MALIERTGSPAIGFRPQSYGRLASPGSERTASADRRARAADFRRFEEDLRNLRRTLQRVSVHESRLFGRASARAGASLAISTAPIETGPPATSTTLASTEEVNAIPTSFTPYGPAIAGASTTLATLGGEYDGSLGDDTLTFEFRDTGVVGEAARLRVRVSKGSGQPIETLRFDDLAGDTPVALSNGLTLSLSSGSAVRFDTFSVDVSASTGSAVDSTRAFDGTRNEQPGFEPDLAVSAGSFELNGVGISVAAGDSIESVLARITASAAGVDAAFDVASERIVLTQKTAGSSARIQLTNDTSGFLEATKLADAIESLGNDAPDPLNDPIASIAGFSSITAGSFSINGVAIAVDPLVDTLLDVITRIGESDAGARAQFDTATRRLSITATDPSEAIVLSNGDSRFFAGTNIEATRYDPRAGRSNIIGAHQRRAIGRDLNDVQRALERVLDRSLRAADADLANLRGVLGSAVTERFEGFSGGDGGAASSVSLGLRLESNGSVAGVFSLDRGVLEQALRSDHGEVARFLFGDDNEVGLLPTLSTRLESTEHALQLLRGSLGRRVDTFA